MVVPRKDPRLLMSVDLRTPVTREQKTLIMQAAESSGLGLAPWCRQILLKAAKAEIGTTKPKK